MTYYHIDSYLTSSPTLFLATARPHWAIAQLNRSRLCPQVYKGAREDTHSHNLEPTKARPPAPGGTAAAALCCCRHSLLYTAVDCYDYNVLPLLRCLSTRFYSRSSRDQSSAPLLQHQLHQLHLCESHFTLSVSYR